MDTVPEKEGQVYKKDSKNIYGLGSVDMKGGTAALLSILSGFNNLKKGILLIFYCDEEDGFAGMKKIVAEKNFFGNLAIFCEPTNLEIANGCRGLVDFEIFVKGKTAHGARPDQGKNVIFISASAFQELEKKIKVYTHKDLGSSVCNFGGFGAGLNTTDGEKILGYNIVMTGNNVPDLALARIEARTALPNLNADIVIKMFDEAVKKFRGKTELNKIIHDKGQLFVAPNQLKLVEEAILRSGIKAVYADLGGVGYYDGAMFYNAFDIPCISLGPGPHEISHQKEEYVSIASLKKIREIYKNIILNFGLIEM
jgi:succinyl-diaminopimelate desuccinylase